MLQFSCGLVDVEGSDAGILVLEGALNPHLWPKTFILRSGANIHVKAISR
jgi:hypothetical protein